MRRTPLVLAVLAALATAAPAAAQSRPPLSARLAACGTGADPVQRFAVFTGSMPALRGTRRMAMRFDLQERAGDAPVERVSAPKLGRWNRSKPGVAGFVYTKRVTRLEQGRWYRALVRFRWYDARGRVQRTARRLTRFCHQPDPRANLRFESLRAARPGTYLVTIANVGLSAAPESTVAVEPRAGAESQRPVPPLAPGERTTVVVEAERCDPRAVVLVVVDRHRVVDESREDDNRVQSPCPPADRLG
jgi:hypothetical protein